MNCANHPGVPAVAYCRTCGKPLCAACKRDVMGVIYCEQCLAERLRDVHPNVPPPAPGFVPATPIVGIGAGPHPGVAGILAGFFPFGVGAVYTGQYAKGLAHLLIFTCLIWGVSSGHSGALDTMLGIALGFFYVYQIIDAVRSAHAVRLGLPAPDPFGFNRTFGMVDRSGAPIAAAASASSPPETAVGKVPTAAVILIGLGVLFLLNTTGLFDVNVERIWPLFLIGLGVWLFVTRSGMLAHAYGGRGYVGPIWNGGPYRKSTWTGPIVLITVGVLFLLQSFNDNMGFGRTWPVLLLVIGLIKLLGNATPPVPPSGAVPPVGFHPPPIVPPDAPAASTEVKNG